MKLQWDQSFDIGSDTASGVDDADIKPPFPLTAKLNKLTINVIDHSSREAADQEAPGRDEVLPRTDQSREILVWSSGLEERFDKREDCRKQADAQKLDPIEQRINLCGNVCSELCRSYGGRRRRRCILPKSSPTST